MDQCVRVFNRRKEPMRVSNEATPTRTLSTSLMKWNEAEAPFHTVGRLSLLPKSQLQPEAADVTYIDLTAHSTP